MINQFLNHPMMTLKVFVEVHWEAIQFWIKKIPLVRCNPPKKQMTVLNKPNPF